MGPGFRQDDTEVHGNSGIDDGYRDTDLHRRAKHPRRELGAAEVEAFALSRLA